MFLDVCKDVGVEDPNKIPNAWMTASSDAGTNFKSYDGRVNMKKEWYRWCPLTKTDQSDYLQVDIGAVRDVCAVATQKKILDGPYQNVLLTSFSGWSKLEHVRGEQSKKGKL